MNREAATDELPEDGNAPATKADIRAAVDELAQITNRALDHERSVIDNRMASMEERLMSVETTLASVEGSQRTLLEIVRSIDERLKGAGDIAARLRYLEDKVSAR